MNAAIKAIDYYLPERVLSSAQLAAEFPEWQVKKIEDKTGIRERHIAGNDECASDLALSRADRRAQSAARRYLAHLRRRDTDTGVDVLLSETRAGTACRRRPPPA